MATIDPHLAAFRILEQLPPPEVDPEEPTTFGGGEWYWTRYGPRTAPPAAQPPTA